MWFLQLFFPTKSPSPSFLPLLLLPPIHPRCLNRFFIKSFIPLHPRGVSVTFLFSRHCSQPQTFRPPFCTQFYWLFQPVWSMQFSFFFPSMARPRIFLIDHSQFSSSPVSFFIILRICPFTKSCCFPDRFPGSPTPSPPSVLSVTRHTKLYPLSLIDLTSFPNLILPTCLVSPWFTLKSGKQTFCDSFHSKLGGFPIASFRLPKLPPGSVL